jgi:FimV-like protein
LIDINQVEDIMLKKTLLTVLIAVSSSPLVAIAALDGMGAPTPVQAYHTDTPPAAAPAKNDAAAMAEVQAIMSKAKQEAAASKPVLNPVASVSPSVPAATPASVPPAASNDKASVANSEGNSDLSSQLSTLSQTNLMFQQRTDQQIENLSSKNDQLTQQLTRMGEALTILNQEVIQLNSKLQQVRPGLAAASPDTNSSKWEQIKPEFMGGVSYLLYAVLAALVVIILLLLPWNRRHTPRLVPANVPPSNEGNEGEYDFMGTHEAIPAKLDLARAYTAMEDYEAAKQVLTEIQKDGNPEQRSQAGKILESIINKS